MLQDGDFKAELAAIGADVVVLPTGRNSAAVAAASFHVLTELRRHRPDVVLANGVKAQLVSAMPARLLGLPVVWVKHDHSYDSSLARPLGRLSTSVVATALEVGVPTGRDDVVVIEPERPVEPLSRAAAAESLAEFGYRPDARPAVVMIGRLVPYKGVDVGIRALAYPDAANWRLAVIGGDDAATPGETDRLRRLAEELGVSDRVTFTGPIAAAGRLVAAFDALAVLTRPGQAHAPQREGYGITATEAMLAGRPVIVAGDGPIARRLRTINGPAGVVVRQGDPRSTANGLAQLADPTVRAVFGARGQRTAKVLPGAADVAARLTEVLRRAAWGG